MFLPFVEIFTERCIYEPGSLARTDMPVIDIGATRGRGSIWANRNKDISDEVLGRPAPIEERTNLSDHLFRTFQILIGKARGSIWKHDLADRIPIPLIHRTGKTHNLSLDRPLDEHKFQVSLFQCHPTPHDVTVAVKDQYLLTISLTACEAAASS